jgi:hypothetical protein
MQLKKGVRLPAARRRQERDKTPQVSWRKELAATGKKVLIELDFRK